MLIPFLIVFRGLIQLFVLVLCADQFKTTVLKLGKEEKAAQTYFASLWS